MKHHGAPRVLYISDSIGLGHAARDLAITAQLRELHPDIEIDWLANDPARRAIEEAGETLLPEAAEFAETGFAEDNAGEFSLNIMRYVLRARGAWKRAAQAFFEVTAAHDYDLVVGDEAYEIMVALEKQPDRKRSPFVMIFDFVGLDAMSPSPMERLAVYTYNRMWGGGYRRQPPKADLVLFVGEPEDVDDRPFGLGLANRREYARRHYEFVGYTFPFDPDDYADRAKVRASLGYDERPLIVCTIGGTSVGGDLLKLCAAAYPEIASRIPNARMLLVTGPRLDPTAVSAPPGVEVRGYVPCLYEHLAASDLTITQSGGTTTLELTALRRPFIHLPLEGHFEQDIAVSGRLRRHGAGEQMAYSETSPEMLADRAVQLLGTNPTWRRIPTDGARKAAGLIDELLCIGHPRPIHEDSSDPIDDE
jgi:predicted glycosyltransferase